MGWQWHQLDHMQMQIICTTLQTDSHVSTSRRQYLTTQILQAGCPSCRPTNIVKSMTLSAHFVCSTFAVMQCITRVCQRQRQQGRQLVWGRWTRPKYLHHGDTITNVPHYLRSLFEESSQVRWLYLYPLTIMLLWYWSKLEITCLPFLGPIAILRM